MTKLEPGYSLLVDSSIYIFRAWHIWPQNLFDASGMPVNAVYGFAEFIYQLVQTYRPERIAFAFDEKLTHSHRRRIFPAYKANRPPAPPELVHQFGLCQHLVRALGLGMLVRPGYEADDLIGTLAVTERAIGHHVAIVTADKDLTQLVHTGDLWWDYARDRRLGLRGIERVFGVKPELIADQLALAGDKIDNIPGIPGIGMATAARLLRPFNGLEPLLADIPRIKTLKLRGASRLMRLVDTHQDTVRLARQLTAIDCHVPLTNDHPMDPGRIDHQELNNCFDKLGFNKLQRIRWWRLLENWPANRRS